MSDQSERIVDGVIFTPTKHRDGVIVYECDTPQHSNVLCWNDSFGASVTVSCGRTLRPKEARRIGNLLLSAASLAEQLADEAQAAKEK